MFIFKHLLFSGVVKTKHYGEKFQPSLVERQVTYDVFIYPPKSVFDNKNVTLHLMLDKLYMIGKESRTNSAFMEGKIDLNKNFVYKNFSPPAVTDEWDYGGNSEYSKSITIKRDISSSYLSETKINVLPGFRLSWWYTGDKVIQEPLSNLKRLLDTEYLRIIFVR